MIRFKGAPIVFDTVWTRTSINANVCEECGKTLVVGSWPWCPHGHGASSIETDESFIGGLTIENMGDQPVTVHSRAELKREMDARGLEQRIKYVPGDKHLTNWALGIDATTLANATALLSRGSQRAEREALLPSLQMEVRALETDEHGRVVEGSITESTIIRTPS